MRALGTTGLRIQGGYVFDEPQRELAGPAGMRVYREMRDSDPIISSVMFAIEMLARQVSLHVEPQKDDVSAQGKEDAAFVQSCWEDLSVSRHDVISEILTCLTYGWAYMETIYKQRGGDVPDPARNSRYSDGKIGWRKFSLRGQDTLLRWEWDDEAGFVRGMHQMDTWTGRVAYIPIEKALLFRTSGVKQNPEGRSLLRGAHSPWYYKKHLQAIEAIGAERDMAGLPVAGVPPEYFHPDASPAEKIILQAFIDIVTGIRNDDQAGVVIPRAYDPNGKELFTLELMSTGGQRQFDTDKIINRYNRDIALFALADFLMLGHEKQGSFALSENKTSMFTLAITAILDSICDVLTRFAIPRLLRLNGRTTENAPVMKHGDVEEISLDALGTYLQKLSLAGIPIGEGGNSGPLAVALLDRAKLPHGDPDQIEDVEASRPSDALDLAAAKPVPGVGGKVNSSGQTGKGGPRQKAPRKTPDQKGTSGGSHTPPRGKAASEPDDTDEENE